MRKLLLIFALLGAAQAQTTPNIGLNIPAFQTPRYDVLLNDNFSVLDNIFALSTCGDSSHSVGWNSTTKTLNCQAITGSNLAGPITSVGVTTTVASTGVIAQKPDTVGGAQFVATTCAGGSACSDANDGLSLGTAKLTLAAAESVCSAANCNINVAAGTYSLSSVLTVSKSGTWTLASGVVISCEMTDPGQNYGCINHSADNVTWQGVGGTLPIITQPNAQNIQTLVQTGQKGNIKFQRIKFDGNEDNQTVSVSKYYSCWASNDPVGAGGHDLFLLDSEVTRCGDRGIDWRGVARGHIERNYAHDTGVNVAGGGSTTHGDALHVGTGGSGPTFSQDIWFVSNEVDKWGDSSIACDETNQCHIIGNTMRGQANFGITPNTGQGGLDMAGSSHVQVVNNAIYDVPGTVAANGCENLGGGIIADASDITVVNNHVYETAASVLTTTVPEWKLGSLSLTCTSKDYVFQGNELVNATLFINDVVNLNASGNSFQYTSANLNVDAIDVSQPAGLMSNFSISNNTINRDAGGAQPTIGINFGANVTTPGACSTANNTISATIANPILWAGGSAGPTSCVTALSSAKVVETTVAALGTCNAGAAGTFKAVSDAAATPVYNATVASGGSVHIPVFCNGTNWTNH